MNLRLHPELRQHLPILREIIAHAQSIDGDVELLATAIDENQTWSESYGWAMTLLVNNRVTGLGGSAFGVPFLSPEFCDALMSRVPELEHARQPNVEEDGPYQIPEIVLKHAAPDLHDAMVELAKCLDAWFMLIYQVCPNSVSSIQLAKYAPSDTPHGNWHHDKDSDFTAVVSLNPEDFEGGGTDIRLNATDYHSVPPLPKGYALIMNGKQVMHRGRGVTKGERHLLVFWLDSVCKNKTAE